MNTQAFPGTADTRTVSEVDAYIKACNAPAAIPSVQPAPTGLWAEARECSDCGHAGINDSHATDSCCSSCGWSGRTPQEDKCPGCLKEGTMSIACPKCGGYYSLITDGYIAAPAATQLPVAWLRNFTDPQPHAVTNLNYRAASDAARGVEYLPVYAGPATQPEGQEAEEAAMYRWWRDAMVRDDAAALAAMGRALPRDVGRVRRPTADEWDAAIRAAMTPAAQAGGGE